MRFKFLTITTSSNSSLGYIRSTNSLKGPCMMSFKISASGGTPQFYAGLATNVANANNFYVFVLGEATVLKKQPMF